MFSQNLSCSNLCSLPLVLSLDTTEKSLALSSLHPLFLYLYLYHGHHDHSKVIDSGLTITSASSLSTCGCILLGPMDFQMSSFAKIFPDLILFHQEYVFLAPEFPPVLWDHGFLKAGFAGKDWWKKGIQYLGLSTLLCNQVSCFIELWAHSFPRLSFVTSVIVEDLLVVFDIPGQIQFSLDCSFPNFIPVCLGNPTLILSFGFSPCVQACCCRNSEMLKMAHRKEEAELKAHEKNKGWSTLNYIAKNLHSSC